MPLVVVDGVAHSQFTVSYRFEGDCPNPFNVSTSLAHQQLSEVVSAFLTLQLPGVGNATSRSSALVVLKKALSATGIMLDPFVAAQDLESAEWCERTQWLLLNDSRLNSSNVRVVSSTNYRLP